MWQPAEGGEAISAADAGYGDTEGLGDAESKDAPEEANVDDEIEGVEDEAPAAEEVAMHVDETVDDLAADELAADADIVGEDPDVAAAEREELEDDAEGDPQ
jgi:hypothetical protein